MRRGRGDNTKTTPFYLASSQHKTSSEIINEARSVLQKGTMEDNISCISGGSGAPRTLSTQRPFTPRERQRTLFGKIGRNSRPPSAVSLKYLQQQSNEYTMKNAPNASKKGQLSSVSLILGSNSDDRLFNQILENIDEKPEIVNAKKKKDEDKTRNIDMEYNDQINCGSKLKLPSLNGLAKPLHHRKMSKISTTLNVQTLEQKDEGHIQNTLSPLISSKSNEGLLNKTSNKMKLDEAEHFPNIQNLGSSEIFNKKRLFNNFKSEEGKFANSMNDYIVKVKNEQQNDTMKYSNKDNYETISNVSSKLNSVKIAIPSPELVTNLNKHDVLSLSTPTFKKSPPSKLQNVYNILENLNDKETKSLTDEDVIEMLIMLYNTLDQEGLWQCISGDEKALILKTLYNYVESTNETLLIGIARIILALRVTGSNLSGVCKLIFKVARNDKNDHLFLNHNLLELFMIGLGRAEPLHDAECLVYGYGALKFLGMNSILLEYMRPLGVLPLMTLHLKMFNESRTDDPHSVGEQGCHGLYQLTGALRNMAGSDVTWNTNQLVDNKSNDNSLNNNLSDFITGGTLHELCRTIYLFSDDLDIEVNVSRTLSVLSADFECCIVLCEQKHIIPAIIKLLKLYTDRAPLVVRLTYILGNMVACNDDIRMELYDENDALNVLLKVLNLYLKRCWPAGKVDSAENIIISSDLDGSNGSDEDVMVKCIRIIANMCMNSTVGARLVESNEIGDQILSWILKCLHQHSPSESAELLVSTLAALNNLSYYHMGEDITSSAFGGHQIHICEALCRFLSQEIGPCVTETARVLGNMSRSKTIRDFVVNTGALRDIINLTKCDDQETSLAAAGVLVNMAADEASRQVWIEIGGIREAAYALHNAANNHHWLLAHLLCQALWNAAPLPHSDISLLSPLLLDVLDEQQVFGTTYLKDISMDPHILDDKAIAQDSYLLNRLTWEEFAMVAVNLLDKIDPNMDSPEENDIYQSIAPMSSDLIPI